MPSVASVHSVVSMLSVSSDGEAANGDVSVNFFFGVVLGFGVDDTSRGIRPISDNFSVLCTSPLEDCDTFSICGGGRFSMSTGQLCPLSSCTTHMSPCGTNVKPDLARDDAVAKSDSFAETSVRAVYGASFLRTARCLLPCLDFRTCRHL